MGGFPTRIALCGYQLGVLHFNSLLKLPEITPDFTVKSSITQDCLPTPPEVIHKQQILGSPSPCPIWYKISGCHDPLLRFNNLQRVHRIQQNTVLSVCMLSCSVMPDSLQSHATCQAPSIEFSRQEILEWVRSPTSIGFSPDLGDWTYVSCVPHQQASPPYHCTTRVPNLYLLLPV